MGEKRVRGLELLLAVSRSVAEVGRSPATLQTHEHDEVGECRFCGETGVGFDDAAAPSDYCGHDPALVRPRRTERSHG